MVKVLGERFHIAVQNWNHEDVVWQQIFPVVRNPAQRIVIVVHLPHVHVPQVVEAAARKNVHTIDGLA